MRDGLNLRDFPIPKANKPPDQAIPLFLASPFGGYFVRPTSPVGGSGADRLHILGQVEVRRRVSPITRDRDSRNCKAALPIILSSLRRFITLYDSLGAASLSSSGMAAADAHGMAVAKAFASDRFSKRHPKKNHLKTGFARSHCSSHTFLCISRGDA
jgi:hypothetical protein